MRTSVIKAYKILRQTVQVNRIPDGEHQGFWSGYSVSVTIGTIDYLLDTERGMRGINVPCKVIVKDGVITVE